MGIFVENNKVEQVAAKIRCETLKALLSYLGSKVGDNMSRIQPWNDMLNELTARLSKWKMKTLSIGGRLTLLKSVLELNSRKPSWVKWRKVLASKEKGRLGIYGEDGKLDNKAKYSHLSIWWDIIREIEHLKNN
ncbi:hypothetical protein Tco_1462710, partial [Tanacetum coccineum]